MEAELWELIEARNLRGVAEHLGRNRRRYEQMGGRLEAGEARLGPDAFLQETWEDDRPLRGLPGVLDGGADLGVFEAVCGGEEES